MLERMIVNAGSSQSGFCGRKRRLESLKGLASRDSSASQNGLQIALKNTFFRQQFNQDSSLETECVPAALEGMKLREVGIQIKCNLILKQVIFSEIGTCAQA
jgi:hypothetical protein